MAQNSKPKRIVPIGVNIAARSGVELKCQRITPKYAGYLAILYYETRDFQMEPETDLLEK